MKSTKKLLVSIAALVIAVALTVSTTYAWFTINANPTIDGFDANITTGTEGLFLDITAVGATAGQHKQSFTKEEFLTAIGLWDANTTGLNPNFKFTDVTPEREADGSLKFTANQMAMKKEGGAAITANNVTVGNEGSYIAFDVHFRSSQEYNIVLTENSATGGAEDNGARVLPSTGELAHKVLAWKALTTAEYGMDIAQGAEIATRGANAVRLGFVNTDATTTTTAKVWDPNSDKGASTGSSNLAVDYRDYLLGNTTPTTIPTGAEDGDVITRGTTALVKLVKGTDGVYTAKLTVNIWLEGWDADCLNTILADMFTTHLLFTGTPVAP